VSKNGLKVKNEIRALGGKRYLLDSQEEEGWTREKRDLGEKMLFEWKNRNIL